MLHPCIQRFNMTGNLKKIYKIFGTKQALAFLTEVVCHLNVCRCLVPRKNSKNFLHACNLELIFFATHK